jgi:hypothetical protein
MDGPTPERPALVGTKIVADPVPVAWLALKPSPMPAFPDAPDRPAGARQGERRRLSGRHRWRRVVLH